jgi:HSP20 family molecular chaperone IbpA
VWFAWLAFMGFPKSKDTATRRARKNAREGRRRGTASEVPDNLARPLKRVREMSSEIPIEVHHGRHSIAVVARLPGVHLEDVRIGLTRDELTITQGMRRCSLALASPIDDRRATIRFSGGVLWVHLPRLRD